MKYAIDRYLTGVEKEVCADDFYGKYIPRRSNRFYCPECGLQVYWVSKGGNQPNKFKHPPRTENSPECDKRVDGRSDLYLYERVGLPLHLTRISDSNFQLAISFPAIGSKMLANAASCNTKITIRANGNNRSVLVDTNNFFADSATLIPVNFIPADNSRFAIDVAPSSSYCRKWSDYSEGFTSAGAIFSYDESGGKKIHRDDSITPGRQYYVVARQFSCPYSEVNFKTVGTLKLLNGNYQVYCMTVNVSLKNEQRYSQISNFFRFRFAVGLLETPPEIIPLWPPVIERDVLVPTKDTRVFCAITSGNDEPTVYSYVGNQVLNVPVHTENNGEKHIYVSPSTFDTVLSVDRKYVGREIVFRAKEIAPSLGQYEYSFSDAEHAAIEITRMSWSTFAKGGSISSNAKMDLYIGSVDHNYLHIPLRDIETQLPTFQNLREIILQAENGTIGSYRLSIPNNENKKGVALDWEDICNQFYGEYVHIPRWAYQVIETIRKNGSTKVAKKIMARAINGKLPIGIISALERIRRAVRSG